MGSGASGSNSQHSLDKVKWSPHCSGWLSSGENRNLVFPDLSIFHEKLKIQYAVVPNVRSSSGLDLAHELAIFGFSL